MEPNNSKTETEQGALLERICKELESLKEEVVCLRLENAELKKENAELRKENAALKKENEKLKKENESLKKEIAKLKKEIAELKIKKDSHNSSMRPSSDIVKPKPKPLPNGKKRKQGGQKGHKRNLHKPIEQASVNEVVECRIDSSQTCSCGGDFLESNELYKAWQQIDFCNHSVIVTEYRRFGCRCETCGKILYPSVPKEVYQTGLFGPGMQALTAYLKVQCHMSVKTIKTFYQDVFNITISSGYLCKVLKSISNCLELPYNELIRELTCQQLIHADETGGKTNGKRRWIWVFGNALFVVFKIALTRGSVVLHELLGKDFDGVVECDFWSAYKKFSKDQQQVAIQFCWAHLIRDLIAISELPGKHAPNYGTRLLEQTKKMFELLNSSDSRNWQKTKKRLQIIAKRIKKLATTKVPEDKKCRNMCKRFLDYGDCYFQFLENPQVPPTNNYAEQLIRTVVIDRHITQGNRSEWGERLSERLWTVIATCKCQGRNVMDYLIANTRNVLTGQKSCSLLPAKE